MVTMTAKEVMADLMNKNTGGFFYKDNCRINYSSIYGFYCKDYINGKMKTYVITDVEAENIIIGGFKMKKYLVVNCEFNQKYYSDIIGKVYEIPPSYAIVKEV